MTTFSPRFTITNRITADLTTIERARGFLVAAFLDQGKLSVADCEKLPPDVARRTIQRDLKRLVEEGIIEEVGHGPTDPTRYYRWLGGEL